VCDGSSGRQTHAAGEAAFKIAQEGDNDNRRTILAENLSKMSDPHAHPQEILRLWTHLRRNGLPLDTQRTTFEVSTKQLRCNWSLTVRIYLFFLSFFNFRFSFGLS
jgi:hypothetical protein